MSAEGAAPAGHRIHFAGDGPEFVCAPGDTLLRAALRRGVGLPYECASGGCGACRVQLKAGELEDVWPQAPGLPARARDRGYRLACQSRPRSDCTISIRVPLHASRAPAPARRSARLVARRDLTQDMAEFSFQTRDSANFLPGQFALISLPGLGSDRAYSMSNLPNGEGRWSFVIKRMPNGAGSPLLFDQLGTGTELTLDGPYGLAHLRADSPRDIVGIAGGSGLSPLLSIFAAAARSPFDQRKLKLYYGGRRPADLCAPAMLADDPAMSARVECVTAISDPDHAEAWSGERGFIHEVVRRHLEAPGSHPANQDYYFCGPPAMTEAVQRMLLELRVPTGQMHYDRFV